MDTIQMTLRGVPVAVADVLRAQAKQAGKSLNQYMIDRLSGETARFIHQQKMAEMLRAPGSDRRAFEETRRLLNDMKDEWE